MTEQYPNYEPSWPLQVFGQLYHDQGMKKLVAFISLITQQPGNAKQKQQQPSLLGNVMRK